MIYRGLQEIFDAKSVALEKITQAVKNRSTAQAHFHPSTGAWSIADIVEHLCLVETQMLRLVASLLKKTEEAGSTTPRTAPVAISVQEFYERSRSEKYSARDKFLPTGLASAADSLKCLGDIQTHLLRLDQRLQFVDLAYASFPHWVFGQLTLGQWLAFIGLHEERHCAQIEAILASTEFQEIPL